MSLLIKPAEGASRSSTATRSWSVAILLLAIVAIGTAGILQGPDGNYDLRNYHFYNGWALLHKSVGFDIAPAQVQSYHHPLLDTLFYLVSRLLNNHPAVFTFVWCIPQAIAVWCTFHIACLLLRTNDGRPNHLLAFCAAIIGASAATTIGVVGTSMSDGVQNLLVMIGIWLVSSAYCRACGSGAVWRFAVAGILAGTATALKLTMVPYCVALGVATLITPGATLRRRIQLLLPFGTGAFLSLLIIGGPWWLAVYKAWGNPLFPYYNTVFHSPMYGDWNFIDDRFTPKTLENWLVYPLQWTLRKSRLVSEEPVRDARILLELASAVILLTLTLRRKGSDRQCVQINNSLTIWCAFYVLVTYVLWLKLFSILRYASGLETMSGLLIVRALQLIPWPRSQALRTERVSLLLACATAVLLLTTNVYPHWERRRGNPAEVVSVSVHPLSADAVVLLLVAEPASYVAAFEPPSVRFIGLHNSLLALNSTFGLQGLVERTIADASGSIWGMDKTDAFFGQAEQTLARYHLHQTGECYPIISNVDNNLRLCRLQRDL